MVCHQRHNQTFHAHFASGAPSLLVFPMGFFHLWLGGLGFYFGPLGAFHLGLPWPCLYLHILFVLWQEVQLYFVSPSITLPKIHLMCLLNIDSFCFHNGVSLFHVGMDQLVIEKLGHIFNNSSQVIGKNFKWSIFLRCKCL